MFEHGKNTLSRHFETFQQLFCFSYLLNVLSTIKSECSFKTQTKQIQTFAYQKNKTIKKENEKLIGEMTVTATNIFQAMEKDAQILFG